jgi:hypothetical protein
VGFVIASAKPVWAEITVALVPAEHVEQAETTIECATAT